MELQGGMEPSPRAHWGPQGDHSQGLWVICPLISLSVFPLPQKGHLSILLNTRSLPLPQRPWKLWKKVVWPTCIVRNQPWLRISLFLQSTWRLSWQFQALWNFSSFIYPGGSVIKNLPANAADSGLIAVGKIPWRRSCKPFPVFLPGKSHGQRSLVGYCLWCRKKVRHNLATKQQHPHSKPFPPK